VLVPPAYTTMTCSSCGSRAKTRLALPVRTASASLIFQEEILSLGLSHS